ncbi:MAG: DUF5916 domain-containing protein, partial [Cyclobacteriaceae bacterium]|nr:DUF5916 domain-containing protein [Cyclobacteriaceae bacterium]
EPHDTKLEGEFGADIKYSITPNVTLDLTYNTDFAQVEVDEQQVNLNRFNLFFPEKRPFFLENAGLFSVGSPGEVDMFFSRKIGIAKDNLNQAVQVPIIGGARVSGRINQTNVGFLNMFTDDREIGSTEVNNYTVARVNHQVASRSTIGAAIINKTDVKSTDNYNRVFALDGKIGLGKKAQITSYIAKSSTPGIENQDYSYRLQAQYEWNGLRLNADLNEVAPEFNPEVGFLGRDPFRKYEFMVFKRVRSENWQKMLEVRPHITYRGYWDSNNAIFTRGFHQTGFLHVDNHWVWKNGLEIHTGVNFTKEGLSADFTLDSTEFQKVVIPADTYDHAEAQIVFMTNTSKNIYFSTRSVIGGYFGGQRQMHNGTMGFRLGDSFNSELKAGISYFNLPFGDVFTEIYGWRLSYSLTPRINIQSLIQYNSKYDLWSSNVRFSILQAANSGLFVVFNQLNLAGQMYNRSLTLKYTYLFDVIK